MPGNKTGAIKMRDTNLANDPDYYKKIGRLGGKRGGGKGGFKDRELARRAGRLGGLNSRRGKVTK